MPICKILYLDNRREKALSGLVRADEDERWNSPIEALNELAATGWDLAFPVYGPVPGREQSGQFVEALLLVNKRRTPAQDTQRRVDRTRGQISSAEKKLAACKGTMEEVGLNQHIRSLTGTCQRL